MQIKVDFSKPIRPIGKLNGMNNGPINTYTDRTEEFREMGVDFVRFHETHSVNAKCLEIPYVFPDFDADENDPANYYFDETDAVIEGAARENIEIMYRLGMGTERPAPRVWLTIPKDYKKWARIVCHIIDHYNRGWANGFFFGIRYWEIWNEADLYEYWPGALSAYTDFYCIVAPMLKQHDPTLLIGPCGFSEIADCDLSNESAGDGDVNAAERNLFYRQFLNHVTSEKIPMDFFAWHIYHDASYRTEAGLKAIKDLLADYGLLGKVEIINNEWNPLRLSGFSGWNMSGMLTIENAVSAVASMIAMQRGGVTKAAYYDAEDRSTFCGLYALDGEKKRHFYSMLAFRMLREGETEVYSEQVSRTLRVCASGNGKTAVILLANEGVTDHVILDIQNLPMSRYALYLFDESHNLEWMQTEAYSGGKITVPIASNTVIALRFS